MKNRYLERLKRKRLRHEKAGIPVPIDPITGEEIGPDAQNHHIAGEKFHDDTVRLSRKGHEIINDAFRDTSGTLPGPPHEFEIMGRYIQGVILISDFVLDREWEMAERLISLGRTENARVLDEKKHAKPSGKGKVRRPRKAVDKKQ